MKITVLDGSRFNDKQAAHEYIAASLGFPSYYGKNLDALADSLSELPPDVGVIITNASMVCNLPVDYADGITDTFAEILGAKFRVCVFP